MGANTKRTLIHVFLCVLVIFCLITSTSGYSETDPQVALRTYLLEEAQLDSFGWRFYAVDQKPSDLYAYVIYSESSSAMAPVVSELRRICPDTKLHDFWQNTRLKSFELVLINNADAQRGKAKRLAQITCDDQFDLAAFEAGTLESTKQQTDQSDAAALTPPNGTPSYPVRDILPDADLQFYAIQAHLDEEASLNDARYQFPEDELERVQSLIARFSAIEINTQGMQVYYPAFSSEIERVPYFEKASTTPPNRKQYSKYYYQNGSVRVETEIVDGKEQVKKNVFYNNYGAPVVVVERWGFNNQRFFAAILEYDGRGYLNRVSHSDDGNKGIFEVSIYLVESGYNQAKKFTFSETHGQYALISKTRHTAAGSYIWDARNGKERKYTSTGFLESLNFRGKYPFLASLVPIPLSD